MEPLNDKQVSLAEDSVTNLEQALTLSEKESAQILIDGLISYKERKQLDMFNIAQKTKVDYLIEELRATFDVY